MITMVITKITMIKITIKITVMMNLVKWNILMI